MNSTSSCHIPTKNNSHAISVSLSSKLLLYCLTENLQFPSGKEKKSAVNRDESKTCIKVDATGKQIREI